MQRTFQELMGHEEDTAGGIMTNAFIAYRPETSVKEAIESFRRDAEEVETIYYIYVTDAEEETQRIGVAQGKFCFLRLKQNCQILW